MQERYLGDVHDYIKFALLRHLREKLKVRIGVNWYLTGPENNNDGGQRGFLKKSAWKSLDETLLEKLRPFEVQEYRTFENFERDRILPEDTLYFETKVSTIVGRPTWHNQAISKLSQAQLIFLDQDNGFEIKSMTGRTHKYAKFSEAVDYFERGKIVVAIQFVMKRNPQARGDEIRNVLKQRTGCSLNLPIVLGHVAPNILFITICPGERVAEMSNTLNLFAMRSPFFKKDKRNMKDINRIEIIP